MVLLLLEIFLGIFGLVALIRGKIWAGKKRFVLGPPARLLGLLAMLPPLVLVISVMYAFTKVKNGNLDDIDKKTETMIDTINGIVCVMTYALVFGIGEAIAIDPKKKKRKKRKLAREDDDRDEDNRSWRRSREDDDEDDDDEEDREEAAANHRKAVIAGTVAGGLALLFAIGVFAFLALRDGHDQSDSTDRSPAALTDADSFAGAWPGDEFPVGMNEVVLHILGFPGRDGSELINEHLDEIVPPGSRSRRSFVSNSRLSIFLAPIANADDFAKRINFGRVVSVHGKVISIVCDTDLKSQPRSQGQGGKVQGQHDAPSGDSVALAIQDLKSNVATRQKTGCDVLASTQPDQRRTEILPLLETLVNLPDLDLRYAATRAYCVWATRDNVTTLIKLLNNEKYLPRMKFVMEALARLKDERGLAPISQWLGRPGNARLDSISALTAYGSSAEDHVIALLSTTDVDVRTGACEILEKIGTKKCLPALEHAAMDSNFNVRLRAKRALDTIKKRL